MPNKYKKEELKDLALKVIEKYKLVFITDVEANMPCSRVTLWNHGLTDDEDIQEALTKNKVNMKLAMRQKWFKSNNASLQISLYKLMGTSEERDVLNAQKIDVTTDDITKLSADDRAKRIKELREKLNGFK
jgi:hypothetical protein